MLRGIMRWVAPTTLAGLIAAAPAWGQESGTQVTIHAFGDWIYGRTDGDNNYASGTPKGNYRATSLGVNIRADVSDRLSIETQTHFHGDESEVHLEYAFADWKASDRVHFRAGQVKQPFGLYTETFSVGTLRPLIDLPQVLYGLAGIIGESYKGVGLTGNAPVGRNWSLAYDLYIGGTDLEEFFPPEAYLKGEPFSAADEIEVVSTRDVVGGRLLLTPPVDGLRIGGAFYTGQEIGSTRRTSWEASGEYVAGRVELRSEVGHETVRDDLNPTVYYIEGAYRFSTHWQVAGQYGNLTSDLHSVPSPSVPSLLDHREVVVGLNYWFHTAFVLKVNYHHVTGNRLAIPDVDALASTIAAGALKTKTNLVQVAAQFSF